MVKKEQQPSLPIHAQPPVYEPNEHDLVSDMLSMVLQLAPQLSAAIAEQVEREARAKWGGDRVYIQRLGGTTSQRNALIKRQYQAGERIAYLSRRHGLSPARLYAIINS